MDQTYLTVATTVIIIAVTVWLIMTVGRRFVNMCMEDRRTLSEIYVPMPLRKGLDEDGAMSLEADREVQNEIHKHFVSNKRAGVRDERPAEDN